METSENNNNSAMKISQEKMIIDKKIEVTNKSELLNELQKLLDTIPGNTVLVRLSIGGLVSLPEKWINMELKDTNKPITINLGSLIEKVEINTHPADSKQQLSKHIESLQSKLTESLLSVLNSVHTEFHYQQEKDLKEEITKTLTNLIQEASNSNM